MKDKFDNQAYLALDIGYGVRCAAQHKPNKVALGEGTRSLNYGELAERINRVSNGVRNIAGLDKGDRVALIAPNCIEYPELSIGIAQAGLIVVTLNPKLTSTEIKYICEDCDASMIFVHPSAMPQIDLAQLPSVKELVVIGDDYEEWLTQSSADYQLGPLSETDIFAIVYTAGTTGKPKGVMLSHRSRVLTFLGMASEYGCYTPDDRTLAVAPLFHGAGFSFAIAALFFGGYCEISPKFEAASTLEKLKELDITNVFMVPTHFQAIFNLPAEQLEGLKSNQIKTIISNASALPQALKKKVVGYFGHGILHETYGSTEAGIVCNLRPADQLRKERCVGLGFACTETKVLTKEGLPVQPGEVGELYSRSPYLFSGYWGNTLSVNAMLDGWFSAGDLARLDEEGFVYLIDRKMDMIISGGVNIYPREIEEVLYDHPAIADTAVIGVPDLYWGESVKAYVVLRDNHNVDSEGLNSFCREVLAGYKTPKSFEFVAALPRGSTGKVLKRELRNL
jgi:long-chain acyl-CoA synthetase